MSLVVLALASGCGDDDDNGGPAGPQQAADLVWVDSVSAVANSQVTVDINMRNSTAIIGAEVPLRLSGTGFTIDSGSFVGGLFSDGLLTTCTVDSATQTVFLLTVGRSSLASGEGLFASLYVSLAAEAAGQEIAIDSAMIPVGGNVYHVVSYGTADLTQILPAFESGKIVVAPSGQ